MYVVSNGMDGPTVSGEQMANGTKLPIDETPNEKVSEMEVDEQPTYKPKAYFKHSGKQAGKSI